VTTFDGRAADHVMKFPRPSRSVFAYCKRSKTGGVEGLGTRLVPLVCHLNPIVFNDAYISTYCQLMFALSIICNQKYSKVNCAFAQSATNVSMKAHVLLLQEQTELYPTQPEYELKRLSDTRWGCRYAAVDTMCRTFNALHLRL